MSLKPDNTESGFRLDRFEILNWGTFDQKIWSLEPKGKTTLLTGKNGSEIDAGGWAYHTPCAKQPQQPELQSGGGW
jgi:hypothetical protein